MWSDAVWGMLGKELLATLYMTLTSAFVAYLLGLPVGVLLVLTAPGGLKPLGWVYKILDIAVNLLRSVPFLILMICVIPLTRWIAGRSYGPGATIVPLTLAAAPFIARLVQASLQEVDKGVIEAAQSMGAGTWTIVSRVMLVEARSSLIANGTIALGTILGYSAMAGAMGGGGLGDVAIRYGYHRYQVDIMLVTVGILVLLVQGMQWIGGYVAMALDKRRSG